MREDMGQGKLVNFTPTWNPKSCQLKFNKDQLIPTKDAYEDCTLIPLDETDSIKHYRNIAEVMKGHHLNTEESKKKGQDGGKQKQIPGGKKRRQRACSGRYRMKCEKCKEKRAPCNRICPCYECMEKNEQCVFLPQKTEATAEQRDKAVIDPSFAESSSSAACQTPTDLLNEELESTPNDTRSAHDIGSFAIREAAPETRQTPTSEPSLEARSQSLSDKRERPPRDEQSQSPTPNPKRQSLGKAPVVADDLRYESPKPAKREPKLYTTSFEDTVEDPDFSEDNELNDRYGQESSDQGGEEEFETDDEDTEEEASSDDETDGEQEADYERSGDEEADRE